MSTKLRVSLDVDQMVYMQLVFRIEKAVLKKQRFVYINSKYINKTIVRSGIRTHARIRGPEHPNSISHVIEQALCLSLAP